MLYYVGATFRVEWYRTAEGRLPALDYYRGMSELDQERLDYMVKYLADSQIGTRLPKVMYRVEDLEHKIYAFKPRAERWFNFTTQDRRLIITNAYRKHSQQMTKEDSEKLNMAIRSRREYLIRVKEGTYYES